MYYRRIESGGITRIVQFNILDLYDGVELDIKEEYQISFYK